MYKMTNITTFTKRRRRGEKIRNSMRYVCVKSTICCTHNTMLFLVQSRRHIECMHAVAPVKHHKHSHTACNQTRLWVVCYLVISRKLRRVERSSRRLICLWHWLQKKSSASSLRKLWKQSGRGAGALERGKYGGKGGGSGEWQTRMMEELGEIQTSE